MSESWNTKYGRRRVRRDPPTLEEAIFAARGLTDDLDGQVEIAASLMGASPDTVRAEIARYAPPPPRASAAGPVRKIEVSRGAQAPLRTVVVERKIGRRRLLK